MTLWQTLRSTKRAKNIPSQTPTNHPSQFIAYIDLGDQLLLVGLELVTLSHLTQGGQLDMLLAGGLCLFFSEGAENGISRSFALFSFCFYTHSSDSSFLQRTWQNQDYQIWKTSCTNSLKKLKETENIIMMM